MGAEEDLAAQGELGDPAALTDRLFRDMVGALELLTVYLGVDILPVKAGMLRFYRLTP